MTDDTVVIQQADRFVRMKAVEPEANEDETRADGRNISSSKEPKPGTLFSGVLGHVNFDGRAADNTTVEAVAAADHREYFRREVYVCIKDTEQNIEFLGRIVQGPFYT